MHYRLPGWAVYSTDGAGAPTYPPRPAPPPAEEAFNTAESPAHEADLCAGLHFNRNRRPFCRWRGSAGVDGPRYAPARWPRAPARWRWGAGAFRLGCYDFWLWSPGRGARPRLPSGRAGQRRLNSASSRRSVAGGISLSRRPARSNRRRSGSRLSTALWAGGRAGCCGRTLGPIIVRRGPARRTKYCPCCRRGRRHR